MNQKALLDLLEQRKVLSDFLFYHRDDLKRIQEIKRLEKSSWVLQLAENITLTTRAPKAWAPSRPLHEFHGHPPAPQFEQMRAGKLELLSKSKVAASYDKQSEQHQSTLSLEGTSSCSRKRTRE